MTQEHNLTELELDRTHSHLFADEEKLSVAYDGSVTVGVDAQDIEDLVDASPELAFELYEAFWDNQEADYVYSDKYLGEYTEYSDGTFKFVPYA